MSDHTPGPWKWMDYPDGRKMLLSENKAVIHCPDAPMTCDPADQRLIAAAPKLLSALLQFGEHKRGCASKWRASTGSSQIGPCDCGLTDAIAKAEGR